MYQLTPIPPLSQPIPLTPLERTIVSLVRREALLKLTSSTIYPQVLHYCLQRTQHSDAIDVIIIDHKNVHENEFATSKALNLQQLQTHPPVYFHCTLREFHYKCCMDKQVPLTAHNADDLVSILKQLIDRKWLIHHAPLDHYLNSKAANIDVEHAYCVNLLQLQTDLKAMGCDLMVISN